MVTAAEGAMGTALKWGSYSIVELSSINGMGVSREDIDVTSHDSTGDFREFIAGLATAKELTLEGNLITSDSSGQMQAITDCLAGTKKTVTITFPNTDASTYACTMYCKDYEITAGMAEQLKIRLIMKPSGVPTWTV